MNTDYKGRLATLFIVNDLNVENHVQAIGWRSSVPARFGLSWLRREYPLHEFFLDVHEPLVSSSFAHRYRREIASGTSARIRRANNALAERLALLIVANGVVDQLVSHREITLNHTLLGGPKIRGQGPLAAQMKSLGLQIRDLHVSFSHDGDAHLAVAACEAGLRGLGIDIVHLPRLQGRGRDYTHLYRLARRFMSNDEYLSFRRNAECDDPSALAVRAAGHFSLMESASKALGTGLKLGLGMGRAAALPRRSLCLSSLTPVEFALGPEAEARCRRLRARRLEGYWAADHEYLVSLALLWE